MCSGSEADSYVRLIDFVYHSTLGLRVIKKKIPRDRASDGRLVLEGGGVLAVLFEQLFHQLHLLLVSASFRARI